jgi:disulfide oxidoreductase YuzD
LNKPVEIEIYGATQICASCVNLPSSKDTYEWLQAAISRKYPNQPFNIEYIDIFAPPSGHKKEFSERVIDEDLFYPVILVNGEIVGEGNPQLKAIYAELERHGYEANAK